MADFSVEVVSGVLVDGHAAPALVVTHGQERVLVNVPEGCQRMCGENKVRMARMNHIVLTRLHADSVLGIGGMLLTLSGVAAAADGTFVMDAYGPPGLGRLVHAHHHVYKRKKSKITVHEVENPAKPLVLESGLEVVPVALRRQTPKTEQPEASAAEAEVPRLKRQKTEPEEEDYGAPISFGEFHVRSTSGADDSARTRNGGALDTDDGEAVVCCYAMSAPGKRGKFVPAKAIELGVKKGPDFGRLTRGETVTTPDGKTVKPDDCMEEAEPGQHVVIITCPEPGFMPDLIASETLGAFREAPGTRFVMHLISDAVLADPAYRNWMRKFTASGVEHIVFTESLSTGPKDRPIFLSSARIQAALHAKVSGACFDADLSSAKEAPPSLETVFAGFQGDGSLEGHDASLLAQSHAGRARNVCVLHPESRRGFYPTPGFGVPSIEPALPAAPETCNPQAGPSAPGDWSITFLGTGSAIPSKYRNVSSILLRTPSGSMLLDAGEGTCGQLARLLGPSEAHDLVRDDLKCVYITHMHADHNLGLLNVLAWRARAPGPGLVVVGPRSLGGFLEKSIRALPGPRPQYRFIALDHAAGSSPPGHAVALDDVLPDVRKATSVLVRHCYDAYGVAIEMACGKCIVYSGDTEPCDNLVRLGTGAHLLIHEATFEDEKVDQARFKHHSTVSEAVTIGKRMGVDYTVLTHFSQRYPKVSPQVLASAPSGDASKEETKVPQIAVASDLMTLRPGNLDEACGLGSAVEAVLDELEMSVS